MEKLLDQLGELGPGGPESPEELMAMLEQLEKHAAANVNSVPPELTELLRNVKKEKGVPVEDDVPTEEVVPDPSFVVKTSDDAGGKVFINVCSSPSVPAPGSWAGGLLPAEVEAALGNLDNLQEGQAEALRFPLSLGPARSETDRQGQPCTVFDVVLNADVLAAASRLRQLKNFLIELCLQWITSRAKTQLDRKFKLPKMRYKGDVLPPPAHRIRLDRKALVTEIHDSAGGDNEPPTFALRTTKAPPPKPFSFDKAEPAATSPLPSSASAVAGASSSAAAGVAGGQRLPASVKVETSAAAAAAAMLAHHTGVGAADLGATAAGAQELQMAALEFVGRPVEAVQCSIRVPPAVAATLTDAAAGDADGLATVLQVGVCGRALHVAVPRCRELTVSLPFAVAADKAVAQWDAGGACLSLRLPYLPLRSWVDLMRQDTPHAFADVRFANESFLELEP